MATTTSTRRTDQLGLYRRRAYYQAAQDGYRLSDGRGQSQPRLLEHLKGQQHYQHLRQRREGYALLGRDDGQRQFHWDHFRVEQHRPHIESR